MSDKVYKGSCFCGAVEVTATGEPAAMGYCHCDSCRHSSAGPVNAFTLWPPAAVEVTKGEANVGSFAKTPKSIRKWPGAGRRRGEPGRDPRARGDGGGKGHDPGRARAARGLLPSTRG